jgi:hypothetical protein
MPLTRYQQLLTLLQSLLLLEEIRTKAGKLSPALGFIVLDPEVPGMVGSTDDSIQTMADQYVAYVYHSGPAPRFVVTSNM